MRGILIDIAALILLVASLFFFYQCVRFVTQRDYVGAVLLLIVGFAVIRSGVELTRLGFIRRR